eukprot:196171-Chlamydomonas_euryale.AAC.3
MPHVTTGTEPMRSRICAPGGGAAGECGCARGREVFLWRYEGMVSTWVATGGQPWCRSVC